MLLTLIFKKQVVFEMEKRRIAEETKRKTMMPTDVTSQRKV